MKKWLLAVVAGGICFPLMAAPATDKPVQKTDNPAVQEQAVAHPGDFHKARKQHEAQLKATQEKMEKLVGEYQKLKGKKKEAKKAEIAQAVLVIREEQIKFKEKQLADFEKRLENMKEALAAQKAPQAQKDWVDNHTEKLIEANGDMRVLFEKPQGVQVSPRPGFHKGKPGMRGPGPKQHEGFGPHGKPVRPGAPEQMMMPEGADFPSPEPMQPQSN